MYPVDIDQPLLCAASYLSKIKQQTNQWHPKAFPKNKPLALKWINNSFLSEEYKAKYRNLLEERYAKLGGSNCQ